MGRTRKIGPSGSFGARYGTSVRNRYSAILKESKEKKACPMCTYRKVKRLSVGIWRCGKCGHTFAGGAYSPVTKLGSIARRAALARSSIQEVGGELTGPIRSVSELIAELGSPKRGAKA